MTTGRPTRLGDESGSFAGFNRGSGKQRVALFDYAGTLVDRGDVEHSSPLLPDAATGSRATGGRHRSPRPSRQRMARRSMR